MRQRDGSAIGEGLAKKLQVRGWRAGCADGQGIARGEAEVIALSRGIVRYGGTREKDTVLGGSGLLPVGPIAILAPVAGAADPSVTRLGGRRSDGG